MPCGVRRKRGVPRSRSSAFKRAVRVGWVMNRASAARLTLPRRATSRKPSTCISWMPFGLAESSMAMGLGYKFYLWARGVRPCPPLRLAEQHPRGGDGERPDRAHGDHERPHRVADRVRVAVERLKNRDRAVEQHEQRHADPDQ